MDEFMSVWESVSICVRMCVIVSSYMYCYSIHNCWAEPFCEGGRLILKQRPTISISDNVISKIQNNPDCYLKHTLQWMHCKWWQNKGLNRFDIPGRLSYYWVYDFIWYPEVILEICYRVGAFLQPHTTACFNSPLCQFLLANRPEALRKNYFVSFRTKLQPKIICKNAWKSENYRFCVKQTIFFNAATTATTPLEWPKILVSYMLHHLSCLYCPFNRWSTKCDIISPHFVVHIFWPTSGKKP